MRGESRPRVSRSGPKALALLLASAGLMACAQTGSTLVVKTPPEHADADLFIDGQYLGVIKEQGQSVAAPRLAPGTHRVELRKPGYFPYQRALRVPKKDAPAKIDLRADLYAKP